MMELRLPISAELLTSNQVLFREYSHFIIQHLKPDTAEIVTRLTEIGCNLLHLVAVDYSLDAVALSSVQARGIAVSVKPFQDIGEFVSDFISNCNRDDVVLWDVGGYATGVISDVELARKVRFAVEDTNNGLWRYQSTELHCPLIEVASIENKKVENAFVGRRIVEGCREFFNEVGLSMPEQDIVVVGFGGIGQSVCAALRLGGMNPAVVEIDQRKLAIAHALGHPIATSIMYLPNAKVIIGCTGVASVALDELRSLSGRAYLISGSSKKIEFSDVLNRGQISQRETVGSFLVELATNCVIANDGEPINLRYGSLDAEISDFMYANIIGAVVEGRDIQGNKIFQLSDAWQRRVCHLWAKRYLQRGHL